MVDTKMSFYQINILMYTCLLCSHINRIDLSTIITTLLGETSVGESKCHISMQWADNTVLLYAIAEER